MAKSRLVWSPKQSLLVDSWGGGEIRIPYKRPCGKLNTAGMCVSGQCRSVVECSHQFAVLSIFRTTTACAKCKL